MNETRDQSDCGTAADGVYRVAVFSRGNDPVAMAEALGESLALNQVDAKIHAAHVPGILPDRLSHDQAVAVASAVQKTGVTAAAIAQSEIPALDQREVIHHAACLEEGLEIFGVSGARSGLIPWDDLEFVSVGYLPLDSAHHYASQSNIVVQSSPHTFEEQSEGVAVKGPACWLITRNPQRVYFINHQQMNYDYLGEQKSSSAAANFQTFLNDLAGAATSAYLTPATHAILNHSSVHEFTFDDVERFKQVTVLQFVLHRVMAAARVNEGN